MSIEDAPGHLQALKGIIGDIEAEIRAKATELHQVTGRVHTATAEAEKQENQLLIRKGEVADETVVLEKDFTAYKAELVKLKTELATLVARKGELQVANAKLEQANRSFQEYEKKAWQALHTKDEDLQARERNMRQKEAIQPVTGTFLPSA